MRVFPALMRRSGAFASALAAASAVAGALMVAATFTTVAKVDVAGGSCEVINDTNPSLAARCKLSGFERHGPALALLGALALAMGLGATIGGSRRHDPDPRPGLGPPEDPHDRGDRPELRRGEGSPRPGPLPRDRRRRARAGHGRRGPGPPRAGSAQRRLATSPGNRQR